MSNVSRRMFLSSIVVSPFAESALKSEPSVHVELDSVPAFYGPHFADELRSGIMLKTTVRRGRIWLTYRGLLVGSLPRLAASLLEHRPSALPIARVDRDENGRLRILVEVEY